MIAFFVVEVVAFCAFNVLAASLFSCLGYGPLYAWPFTQVRRHGVGPCRSGAPCPPRTTPGKEGATNDRPGLVRGAVDGGSPPLPLRGSMNLSCRGGGRRGAPGTASTVSTGGPDQVRAVLDGLDGGALLEELDGVKARCGCWEADGDATYCATARLRALGASEHEAAREAGKKPCKSPCPRREVGAG